MTCPHQLLLFLFVNLDVFPSSCIINPSSDQYCSLRIYLLTNNFQKTWVLFQRPYSESKGKLQGLDNLGSGNQIYNYICFILLNARWKLILIQLKVKLKKKSSELFGTKNSSWFCTNPKNRLCVFLVTITDTIICTQASLCLSGASTTIISILGWQSSTLGERMSALLK